MEKTNNSILVHKLGNETKAIIKEAQDVNESDFFYAQYMSALDITERYCALTEIDRNASISSIEISFENNNNIIAFVGERGSGKTSCMMTFANILCSRQNKLKDKNKYKKIQGSHFYKLPIIDPSFFISTYNIIGSVIATMYKEVQDFEQKQNKKEAFDWNGDREDFFKALVDTQKSYKKLVSQFETADEIEQLEQLSCSLKLKSDMHKLVKAFLKYVGEKSSILVICIDDIDINTANAVEMVEWIRKYLILPNVLILFAVKLNQIFDLKRLSLLNEYQLLIDKKLIGIADIGEMSEKYLSKLIPLGHRVYMPDIQNIPFIKYQIELDNNSYNDKSLQKYKDPRELRVVVIELIFEKTGFLFYNSTDKTSPIIPKNLRETLHLMRMLFEMPDIPSKDSATPDSATPSRAIVLSANQTVFKKYLFNDCMAKYLTPESKRHIDELLSVVDSTQFNATVLRVLREKFKDVLDYKEERSKKENESVFDIEIRAILDIKNYAYNISIGDVLGIVNWLENMERTDEEAYFLFIIRTLYSMKLYEYYDQMFEDDYNIATIAEQEISGKLVLSHPIEELDNLYNYQKLVGGQFINSNLVSIIAPTSDGLDLCHAYLDLKNLKKIIDENIDENNENIEIAEFLMLCTSKLRERKLSEVNYRKNPRVGYAHHFNNKSQKAIFDISSFFYNITDIETCYNRFKDIIGKDKLQKILDIKCQSLYSNLLAVSRMDRETLEKITNPEIGENFDQKIKEKYEELKTQYEELKKNFDNEYSEKNMTSEEKDVAWAMYRKNANKEISHNLISWVCIRNAEIHQDFINDLLNNRRRTSDSKELRDKIKGFFESVSKYDILIPNRNKSEKDDKEYSDLDFKYVCVLKKLFEKEKFAEKLTASIIKPSKESDESSKESEKSSMKSSKKSIK